MFFDTTILPYCVVALLITLIVFIIWNGIPKVIFVGKFKVNAFGGKRERYNVACLLTNTFEKFIALIDTGADISLIRKSVAEKCKIPITKEKVMFIGIGNLPVISEGCIEMDVHINAIKKLQQFVVVRNDYCPQDVLLGTDYLEKFAQIIITTKNKEKNDDRLMLSIV